MTATLTRDEEVAARALVRPWWRRARLWFALLAVLVVAAVLVAGLGRPSGRELDPASTQPSGSRALAQVLRGYGVAVRRTTSLSEAGRGGGAVLVVSPDDYSTAQLRGLARAAGRLVLVQPGSGAVAAVSRARPFVGAPSSDAGCADPGALAAGTVDWPRDTVVYRGDDSLGSCYGGALLVSPRLAVIGSADALRNDGLTDEGVAALDVNTITDSREQRRVTWLLTGPDAGSGSAPSIWDLFPGGAYRVFWYLVGIGLLVAVWRARRLGGAVTEPLPVVVRAAELVEGHGRLYLRSHARARAAAELRTAATRRLARRLGLPRSSSAAEVAAAAARHVAGGELAVAEALGGPDPADDAGLVRLARDLDRIESAVAGRETRK